MESNRLLARCMAWKENGLWVAVCIDYSLAAQADTLAEARQKLHAQIVDYVREALGVHKAHADVLLNRKAPLRDQLMYAFWRAMSRRPRVRKTIASLIRRIGVAIRSKQAYTDPLPIAVAA